MAELEYEDAVRDRLADVAGHVRVLAADADTQNAWLHPCGWTRTEPYVHAELHPPCAPIGELVKCYVDMWPAWRSFLEPALTEPVARALDTLAHLLNELDSDAYRDELETLDSAPWCGVRTLARDTLVVLGACYPSLLRTNTPIGTHWPTA